ncbi:hypothetical protein [Nonomuraea basaltis]|uniref:hypothetical protein n=1 Tax=Nonomuraea basaltis TaxID=2495887 RepID=UPI00110C54F1|nr:hypothetical protein [Nonomuraea basaltis]TMR88834.1 hypothetical protein EJK15_64060 [Nonomuraea basaltis]
MTARAGRNVTALRGPQVTVAAAADAFLSTPRFTNANTHRAYTGAIDRTCSLLGRERPPRAAPPYPVFAKGTPPPGRDGRSSGQRSCSTMMGCR